MKNILLIGVGGTGSKTVDTLFQKIKEIGPQNDNNISAIVFDTDAGDIKKIECAEAIPMADNASIGTICDRIGTDYIKEWFPVSDKAIRSQEMFRGASQWRKKSYLAFINLMSKPKFRSAFVSSLEKMTIDPNAPCEVYIISSVAGGTGSGSFIPIALFARRYLRKNLGKSPVVNAMIALPDIYADGQTPENNTKIYANAYAIFRELNAINKVTRGYNKEDRLNKKTPIKFKIGNVNEPNVGVLFDSMDKSFWTPEAAPFNQVFILDKIPNVSSVTAHNIVLANSLYSLICTDIGKEFDSEMSNHELIHSQNNGSGAIYAGIATSEMRFPKDTILDYIAHEKTVEACNGEWLYLHNEVEKRIKQEQINAKIKGKSFTLGEGKYAELVIEELINDAVNNESRINDLVDRGTLVYDKEGNVRKGINTATEYFNKLDQNISTRITEFDEEILGDKYKNVSKKDKIEPKAVSGYAKEIYEEVLVDYMAQCIDEVNRTKNSLADAIISLDKKKDVFANKDLSLVKNVLMSKDKYIHPVSAMVQLCRLRLEIVEKKPEENTEFTSLLRKREVSEVYDDILTVSKEFRDDGETAIKKFKCKKSNYLKDSDENRFLNIITDSSKYDKSKTDTHSDVYAITKDAQEILLKIQNESIDQLKAIIYNGLGIIIDKLIEKYRSFFIRFDKEKVNLVERTKDIKRKDCGISDSIINIYSSKEEKEKTYDYISSSVGVASATSIMEADDIVGQGVFDFALKSVRYEASQKERHNDKDVGAVGSIFDSMIDANKKNIKASDIFAQIASYNVIEAIKESCGESGEQLKSKLRTFFSTACETAKPSIKIDNTTEDEVMPAYVTVFLMSENTGRYIKRNADMLDIKLPSDQNKESKVIEACAEQFIRMYCGDDSARVAVVPSMPDNIMYCTGEIVDISPLRVAKFNELGEDCVYFKHYKKAISNWKEFETEMWNPHIGNNLHLRGCLPYMNEKMEEIYDENMVKALLYGFWKGKITLEKRTKATSVKVFKINDKDGKRSIQYKGFGGAMGDIKLQNASWLINWFRNEDTYIEEWSKSFNKEITKIKNGLPNFTDADSRAIKDAITRCGYMEIINKGMLTEEVDTSLSNVELTDEEKITEPLKQRWLTIPEFALYVKESEETSRDCDDAERILRVAYKVFKDICMARANPENESKIDLFCDVYAHELGLFYKGILDCDYVQSNKPYWKSNMKKFAEWFDEVKVFSGVSVENPFNENGSIDITGKFDYLSNSEAKKSIRDLESGKSLSNGYDTVKKQDKTGNDVVENTTQIESGADLDSTGEVVKKKPGRPPKKDSEKNNSQE